MAPRGEVSPSAESRSQLLRPLEEVSIVVPSNPFEPFLAEDPLPLLIFEGLNAVFPSSYSSSSMEKFTVFIPPL